MKNTYIQRKKVNKSLNDMKKVNHQGTELIEYLKQKYTFTTDEEIAINTLYDHLNNLSLFINDIQTQMK